jgi:hypothetical protein
VKLKSVAVVVLLVLGCSAAFGQTFSFGFLSSSGINEFCNYEQFTVGGRDNFYVQGYDVLSVCPYVPVGLTAAPVNGFAISVPAAAFAPVHGKAYVYSDQIFDAYYGGYTGEQWTVLTKSVVSPILFGKTSWAGYVGFAGYEFLGNYGFLTTTLPTAERMALQTTRTSTIGTKTIKQLKAQHSKK